MIVKNEEAALGHCLESVKTLVDEIIIVDTGSTDKTIDIANSFGARVHHFKWRDDFSAARNECLKYCGGEWVFILDADEAIDETDREKILNACQYPRADAYSLITRTYTPTSLECSLDAGVRPNIAFPLQNRAQQSGMPAAHNRGFEPESSYGARLHLFPPDIIAMRNNADIQGKRYISNYIEGRSLPFYADNTGLRLARRFNGLAYNGKIHETLGPSLISNGKTIENLDAVIHHYGKMLKEREERKVGYYLTLARQEFDSAPADERAQFNLLQQALVAGRWELALEAAQARLKTNSVPEPLILYGAGLALQELDRHDEAIDYFDLLLKQNSKHALAMLGKGVSLEALGDVSLGRELIIKAIELQPDYVPSRGRLAELEIRANNLDAARGITLKALETAPGEPALYDLLLKIEAARNNPRQIARDALLGIQRCPGGGDGRWHRLAAIYLSRTGERGAAMSILELGLKNFPDDVELIRLKGMIK